MTTHGRHTKTKPHYWLGACTAAVLLLALALSEGWWSAAKPGEQQTPAAPERSDGTAAMAASAGRSTEPRAVVAAAVESCQRMHVSQAPVLVSAGLALGQWRTHVEAMNQLVAGEITLDQATAFWDETRVGAMERIERFTADDSAHLEAAERCPSVPDDVRPPNAAQLWQCHRATATREDLLDAARVAVQTWHHHVLDMERLRAGELSPTQATNLWLRNWRQGVEELEAYDAKARLASPTTC